MRRVSGFESLCTADVDSGRVLLRGCLVDDVSFYALSFQWAFIFLAFLAITCSLYCWFWFGLGEYFLVVGLKDCFHVFCTAVRKFECVFVAKFV